MQAGRQLAILAEQMSEQPRITRDRFDAAIFDLDGVVTRTAALHRATWKELFDDYLAERSRRRGLGLEPFDEQHDYARYVDGKPRCDGAASFLESRGIELPRGEPDDPPERETVCGLANRKDAIFRRRLDEQGVEVYASTIDFIERLRRMGLRIGLFSSSRNCRRVIEAAGVAQLFEATVDGGDLAKLGIPGKPAPHMLLETARRLGAEPGRCIAVEDAIAGVQAGRAGGFGLTVGLARNTSRESLVESGADVAVSDLFQLCVGDDRRFDDLPAAGDCVAEIAERLGGRRAAIFLDYDGTLTPIVDRPADAHLSERMRRTLSRLAAVANVAIVSGRDLPDVRRRVGLSGLSYAGSHGFDVHGASGRRLENPRAAERVPDIDAAERDLVQSIAEVPGVILERKRFSLAVHYRMTPESRRPEVKRAVDAALSGRPSLRLLRGRMVFELQPDLEWDKGRAVAWLLSELEQDGGGRVLYMGDDVTDEDAFRAVRELGGIGIAVRGGVECSAATFSLQSVSEVQSFLESLAKQLEGAS